MIKKSKYHSSLFHHSYVQNPVTVLHLTQFAAGSSESPSGSVDNRKAILQRCQQQTRDWPITQGYPDRDWKWNMNISPRRQVLHWHRHTDTQRFYHLEMQKKNFNIILFTLYTLRSHYRSMKKMLCWPWLLPSPSHWCSYPNLGFNRYQSKLPSKKSREAPSNCLQIWKLTTLG